MMTPGCFESTHSNDSLPCLWDLTFRGIRRESKYFDADAGSACHHCIVYTNTVQLSRVGLAVKQIADESAQVGFILKFGSAQSTALRLDDSVPVDNHDLRHADAFHN